MNIGDKYPALIAYFKKVRILEPEIKEAQVGQPEPEPTFKEIQILEPELLLTVIERYFADWFDLSYLSGRMPMLKTKRGSNAGDEVFLYPNSSSYAYVNFFIDCMKALSAVKDEQEAVSKLYTYLNQPCNLNFLLLKEKTEPQLGYLEKIANGSLDFYEPLSMLDMLRYVRALKAKFPQSNNIYVLHLNHIQAVMNDPVYQASNYVLIDFNLNPAKKPKWGIYDKQNKRVICEAGLTETEKTNFEKAIFLKEIAYITENVSSNNSTGFYAKEVLAHCLASSAQEQPMNVNGRAKQAFLDIRDEFIKEIAEPISIYQKDSQFCSSEFNQLRGFSQYPHYILKEVVSASKSNFPGKAGDIVCCIQRQPGSDFDLRTMAQANQFFSDPSVDNKVTQYSQVDSENHCCTLTIPEARADGQPWSMEEIAKITSRFFYRFGRNEKWVFEAIPEKGPLYRPAPTRNYGHLAISEKLSWDIVDNPWILSIEADENVDNVTVKDIIESGEIQSVLSRNRWLKYNKYCPGIVDNYWDVAAQYWVSYLMECENILADTEDNKVFKETLAGASRSYPTAFKFILDYCKKNADKIEEQLGKKKLPLYIPALSSGMQSTQSFVQEASTFYRGKNYFPFDQAIISLNYPRIVSNAWDVRKWSVEERKKIEDQATQLMQKRPGRFPDLTDAVLHLLQQQRNSEFSSRNAIVCFEQLFNIHTLEKVVLVDVLNSDHETIVYFLNKLINVVREDKIQKTVEIPELDNLESASNSEHMELIRLYRHLNNIILDNRRNNKGKDKIVLLAPSESEIVPIKELVKEKEEYRPDEKKGVQLPQGKKSWPISRGGAQLQLQLQQQLHQQMQQQPEYKRQACHDIDDILPDDLINIDNIEGKLGRYYADLVIQGATPQGQNLQEQFSRWVNAPKPAQHVIQSMTIEAAKALIRKPRGLASGLNPENLPKGFYTQRTKEGHLVLLYKPERGYVTEPNPLTINLNANIPKAEKWLGDFRQFNIDDYIEKPSSEQKKPKKPVSYTFQEKDYPYLALFAMLQPQNTIEREFTEFKENYSAILNNLSQDDWGKIQNHWFIFSQMWALNGEEGVPVFLKAVEQEKFNLSVDEAIGLFFPNIPLSFLSKDSQKEVFLRTLGQVYYQYGKDVTRLLCQKLQEIHDTLGPDFFKVFYFAFIAHCENLSYLVLEESIQTLNAMIASLEKDASAREDFQYIMQQHATTEPWEDVNTLWRGYIYFTEQLNARGLHPAQEQFKGISPQNMLVCMDRILYCLDHISETEEQQAFLNHVADNAVDLNHAGAFYALVYEGFNHFSPKFCLHNFHSGAPTYHPPFGELYTWTPDQVALFTQRLLATQSQWSQQEYRAYADFFATLKLENSEEYCNLLVFILLVQPTAQLAQNSCEHVRSVMGSIANENKTAIAKKLHAIAGQTHPIQALAVDIDTIAALAQSGDIDSLLALPDFLCKIALEIATMLHAAQKDNVSCAQLILQELQNFESTDLDAIQYLKLHFLFERFLTVADFNEKLNSFRAFGFVAKQEARILFKQLLSIDWLNSDINTLRAEWDALNTCLEDMKNNGGNPSQIRMAFIQQLKNKGVVFRGSLNGIYRQLGERDKPLLKDLPFFVDHHARLWAFLQKHIAIVDGDDPQQALRPLLNIFKELQAKRGILNEIEPLLAILEKTEEGHYWTAKQFAAVMQALNVTRDDDTFVYYPVSLLEKVLQTPSLAARPIDDIAEEQQALLLECIQAIANDTHLTVEQKTLLCQIAVKEWQQNQMIGKTNFIFNSIKNSASVEHPAHTNLLKYLVTLGTIEDIQSTFNFAALNGNSESLDSYALWFSHFTNPSVRSAFSTVKGNADLLKIIAFSTLDQGLKTDHEQQDQLQRKLTKLVARLQTMLAEDAADVTLLAKRYPARPCPTADDILRLIKKKEHRHIAWQACLEEFECQPFTQSFIDKGSILATREMDLIRIIDELRVTEGPVRRAATEKEITRISHMLKQLKGLETGQICIGGVNKPLAQMTQSEIQEAFTRLSKEALDDQNNDGLNIQIWALLFTAIGRTTRKYPHLAQQVALIANDVCLTSDMRLLQLDTGEGKSHFIALRAARYAGMGKTVDICTAKESLAERDHVEYKHFLGYVGIGTSYVHARSEHEDYQLGKSVNFCTTGGLSLFFDRHHHAGNPICIDRRLRIGLFDEFDFIRFGKLQYNYAIANERTPKKMHWFYQALNQFYTEKLSCKERIEAKDIADFIEFLSSFAKHNTEKEEFIQGLKEDPLLCVQWLQSAYEADRLHKEYKMAHTEKGENSFTLVYSDIAVGKEDVLLMQEIIPLSSDNQKMFGSTFSLGVHQLLAERLNAEAAEKGEPQNYYVLPESDIINSQVAPVCMQTYWSVTEGFSGTISDQQAVQLYGEHRAQVLHVPTNRPCLRAWQEPQFFDDESQQIAALVAKLRECLREQKSILFACKNDRAVKLLKQQLKEGLSEEELKQLIFYTNEETKTPQDILKEKRQKENWQSGKKTQGIGLIASGFGRGDNCHVEVVFLMDANNENDRRQKGGRTGRNGAAGEVYEFYLRDELRIEETRLRDMCASLVSQDSMLRINTHLKAVPGANEDEQRRHRVLLLREHVEDLMNESKDAYQGVLAQYCAWGMGILAAFKISKDKDAYAVLESKWAQSLQAIEKEWIEITADTSKNTEQKIKAIAQVIQGSIDTVFAAESRSYFHIQIPEQVIQDLVLVQDETTRDDQEGEIEIGKHGVKSKLEEKGGVLYDELNEAQRQKLETFSQRYPASPASIAEAIQVSPEIGLSHFQQSEKWMENMDLTQKKNFLKHFCQVMEAYFQAEQMRAFEILVQQTEAWWNKGENRQYQADLLALWQGLATHSANNEAVVALITPMMGEHNNGKLGFSALRACLRLEPTVLREQQEIILAKWKALRAAPAEGEEEAGAAAVKEQEGLLAEWNTFIVRLAYCVEKRLDQKWLNVSEDDFANLQKYLNKFDELSPQQNDDSPNAKMRVFLNARGADSQEQLSFLNLFYASEGKFKKCPQLIEALFGYMNKEELQGKPLGIRVAICERLMICAKSIKEPASIPQLIADYEAFITSIQALDDNGIRESLSLLTELSTLELSSQDLLKNGVIAYYRTLEDPNKANKQEKVKKVAADFARTLTQKRGNVEQMFDEGTAIRGLFDFHKEWTKEDRIIFMQMLYQERFEVTHEAPLLSWTAEQNTDLLKKGFASYVAQAKKIVDLLEENPSLKGKHDLSAKQGEQLLALSRELEEIGGVNARPVSEQGQRKKLQNQLTTISSGYKTGFFDRVGRKESVAALAAIISSLDQEQNEGRKSNYQIVLEKINGLRSQVLQKDLEENQKRTLFAVNRKGYSEFQRTLNQMQDCVVCHWLEDQEALHSFQAYRAIAKDQFKTLLQGLKAERDVSPSFFRKALPEDVKTAIDLFYEGGNAQLDEAKITADNLRGLKQAISDHKDLPSHIQAVVGELISPMEVLLADLERNPNPAAVAAL